MAKHLTLAERQVLHRMVKTKKLKSEVSAMMNRHRSTVYRELKRNSNAWGYRPETAQRLARERRTACRRPYKLKDVDLRLYVGERLRKAWSPDQIAGRLRREFPREPERHVSAPTIYAWIKRYAPLAAVGCGGASGMLNRRELSQITSKSKAGRPSSTSAVATAIGKETPLSAKDAATAW